MLADVLSVMRIRTFQIIVLQVHALALVRPAHVLSLACALFSCRSRKRAGSWFVPGGVERSSCNKEFVRKWS